MNEFIMTVGLPASGKSTYVNNVYNNYAIHSSDSIRQELYGDESIQGDNTKVFDILKNRMIQDLINNKNVVVDAANMNYKKRKAFLTKIADNKIKCHKKCVIIATPVLQCIENNKLRDRKVPDEVIHNMHKHFNFPAYFEGWDEIEIVNYTDLSKYFYNLEDLYYKYKNYKQGNSHHKYSLYEHCYKTYEYLLHNNHKNIALSGYLHDCGKPFVATEYNTKGKKDGEIHYYGHQNTSSYEAMFYLLKENLNKSDIINICILVQWHMQPYFIKTEKNMNKYRNMWGDKLCKQIMLLHEADKNSH